MKNFKSIIRLFIFVILSTFIYQCSNDNVSPDSTSTGIAGSYARSMIVGNFLYIVDNSSIRTLSLANPDAPTLIDEKQIGERIESIFNLDNRLFIGAGSGLYLYTIEAGGIPVYSSSFSYDIFPILPCDPVVANDSFAYVTLNTDITTTSCGGRTNISQLNVLNIFDVTDFTAPILLAQYQMEAPKGVGLDGEILFVCDNKAGLKIFDVTDPLTIEMIAHFDDFTTYDVIPLNGLLLVVGPESVHQFDYTDLNNIYRVSIINTGE